MIEMSWWAVVLVFMAGEVVGLVLVGIGRAAHNEHDEGGT